MATEQRFCFVFAVASYSCQIHTKIEANLLKSVASKTVDMHVPLFKLIEYTLPCSSLFCISAVLGQDYTEEIKKVVFCSRQVFVEMSPANGNCKLPEISIRLPIRHFSRLLNLN